YPPSPCIVRERVIPPNFILRPRRRIERESFLPRLRWPFVHEGRTERREAAQGRDADRRRPVRRLRGTDLRAQLQGHLPSMRVHAGLQRSVSHTAVARFRRLTGTSSFDG